MLSMQNSGKYLSRTYERLNNDGLEDRRNLSDAEMAFADISGELGGGRYFRETFEVDNISLDVKGPSSDGNDSMTRYIDVRARPECGDGPTYKKKWE